MLGIAVLGAVVATTLLWMGPVPASWLWQALEALLAWAALSTLLVGGIGAWIALNRPRRGGPETETVRRGSVAG